MSIRIGSVVGLIQFKISVQFIVFISPLFCSQPRSQGLSSYRSLGTRLLCSLQSAVYVLHRPVINMQTTTIKPEQTKLNLGEKTSARNVSFTNSLNLPFVRFMLDKIIPYRQGNLKSGTRCPRRWKTEKFWKSSIAKKAFYAFLLKLH